MQDRFFLDSNVIIYSLGKDLKKKEISKSLLKEHPTISTQVVNEVVNVCYRKLKLKNKDISDLLELLKKNCEIKTVDIATIELSISIKNKYKYSYFDCLILASAIQENCYKLFSEDLQHNQTIENKLNIVNPYN